MNSILQYVQVSPNNPSLIRREKKCVNCSRCKDVCASRMGVAGFWEGKFKDIICINCGQCASVCPTDCLVVKDETERFNNAVKQNKTIVCVVSPSVRVSLGEMFNLPAGSLVTKQVVTALKKLGAKYVFDVTAGADLTVMEEASELIDRINTNKPLPQFTSCCPAWVKFVETFYPQYIPNLSTCRSPIGMLTSVIKNYFAKQQNIPLSDLFVVAITPCTAKKFEAAREELSIENLPTCDLVLTVQEVAKLIKSKRIKFENLKQTEFDSAFPTGSGAGTIFGASGGVMEASVRTAYFLTTGKNPPANLINFQAVRGYSQIKTAKVKLLNKQIKLCVIYSTAMARRVLNNLKANQFHFIEVMACPNGCVGGGGQPKKFNIDQTVMARADGLYNIDSKAEIKCSYQNPQIQALYKNYLGSPLSEKAKQILHTTFKKG